MSQNIKLTTIASSLNINGSSVGLNSSLTNFITNLSNEISRGTSVETSLSNNISNEIGRAISTQTSLSSYIVSETTRNNNVKNNISINISATNINAISREASLSQSISSEIQRAISIENSISIYLSNIKTTSNTDLDTIEEIATALSNNEYIISSVINTYTTEVSRATSIENLLSSELSNKISLAVSSENRIQTLVSNETSRAISTETSLSTSLSIQKSTAILSETILSSNLSSVNSSEINISQPSLSSNISTETVRATSVENSISSQLSNTNARLSGITSGPTFNIAPTASYTVSLSNATNNLLGNYISGTSGIVTINGINSDANRGFLSGIHTISVPSSGVWILSADISYNPRTVNNISGVIYVISEYQAPTLSSNKVTNTQWKIQTVAGGVGDSPFYIPFAPGLRYDFNREDGVGAGGSQGDRRDIKRLSGGFNTTTSKDLYVNVAANTNNPSTASIEFIVNWSLTRVA